RHPRIYAVSPAVAVRRARRVKMASSAESSDVSFSGRTLRKFAKFPAGSRACVSSIKITIQAAGCTHPGVWAIELPYCSMLKSDTGRTIMSMVTSSTLKRAFVGDGYDVSNPKSNMAMDGATYGNAGGFKDLLFSILTFGIYSFVKSGKMDQKRAAIEVAIRDLHQQIESKARVGHVSVKVDGKMLSISEVSFAGNIDLHIMFDDEKVGVIQNTDLKSFQKNLAAEVGPVPKLYDDSKDVYDGPVY
ncbi:hypothetical protein, partial [Paraburkholderia sp. RL17-373-BIF-A]|uniref:hypothetical protein n=1 Tax=Paraburkholderia sp. RL17-373-BIF-A TaxID=3031629 RepID=UPI0038B968A8